MGCSTSYRSVQRKVQGRGSAETWYVTQDCSSGRQRSGGPEQSDRARQDVSKVHPRQDSDELGPTPVELLMRHGLNFSHINADNPQDAALNEPFLALAHRLSSTGARHTTLRFPKAQGDGEPDEILLNQFRLFKKRYVENVGGVHRGLAEAKTVCF